MTTFYLVRHGAKQHPVENKLLSDIGIKQAVLTGKYLKDKNIQALHTSPLKRTHQTAEIIATELQLPIITDERLRERMNFGDRPGETFEEFLAQWDLTQLNRDYQPPHGDSSYVTGQRVKAVLDEITKEGNIVIVTHGGAIGDFLQNVFSKDKLPLTQDPLSGGEYIEISECSVTTVEKNGGQYVLKRVNDTSHLPTPIA